MRVNVYVVIALLCISSLVAAAEGIPFERAVDKCVKEVTKELPYSSFDAYVKDDDNVHMFGTAESRFKFRKCMAKNGHPITTDGK